MKEGGLLTAMEITYIYILMTEEDGTIVIDYDYLVKLFSPEKIEYLQASGVNFM